MHTGDQKALAGWLADMVSVVPESEHSLEFKIHGEG